MEALNDGDNGHNSGLMAADNIRDMSSIASDLLMRPSRLPEPENPIDLQDDIQIEPHLELNKEPRIEIPDWEIAVIVICTILATAALLGLLFWWMQHRRNKSKNNEDFPEAPHNQHTTINNNVEHHKINGGPHVIVTSLNGTVRSATEEQCDAVTEYGSITESFPPSPTLSFRSVIDGAGFNRSRAGTGTSFGTVASFASDRTSRSRASTVASFQTCYEHDTS